MIQEIKTWSMIRRRGWLISLLAVGCLCGSIVLAFTITPIYRSEGRLLVEQADIPADLIRTTVRGFGEERIELVRKLVMTDENIMSLVHTHEVYAGLGLEPRREIQLFRQSSSVVVEEMDDGTLSFLVAFDDEDPRRARNVAVSLMTLFQEENVKSRTESAASTAAFLENEAERVAIEIAEYEERIAEYKEINKGGLPEQVKLNIQFLDRVERELENVEREIRSLEQRQGLAEADLLRARSGGGVESRTAPLPGSADRLPFLQAEYLRMLSIYSSEHPDIRQIRREIEMLDPGALVLSRPIIEEQIRLKQQELADLRNRYSSDHPDVAAAERALERLEAQLESAGGSDGGVAQVTDPNVMRLSAIMQGIAREIEAQRTRRQDLRERITVYEERLTNAPKIQRELLSLTRGYDQLQEKYDDVKLDQEQVELVVSVEKEQRGGRFALSTSPSVPDTPYIPNRPATIFLGLLLGIGSGLLAAVAIEAADKSLRDELDIRDVWEAPPLVAIPQIRNQLDLRRHAVRVSAYVLAMGVMLTGAVLTVIWQ